jgi:hypothetical protein
MLTGRERVWDRDGPVHQPAIASEIQSLLAKMNLTVTELALKSMQAIVQALVTPASDPAIPRLTAGSARSHRGGRRRLPKPRAAASTVCGSALIPGDEGASVEQPARALSGRGQ